VWIADLRQYVANGQVAPIADLLAAELLCQASEL